MSSVKSYLEVSVDTLYPITYGTISHRLSMQLLSPAAFGSIGGLSQIQMAISSFSDSEHVSLAGFEYDLVPPERIDFLRGPNVVVGYMDAPIVGSNNPLMAFIYDGLVISNIEEDSSNNYQARLVMESSLDLDDHDIACSVLRHALTTMVLKAKLHSHLKNKNASITLGIGNHLPTKLPDLVSTLKRSGFDKKENLCDSQLQLFHIEIKPTRQDLCL